MKSKDVIKLLESNDLIIKKIEHEPLMNMEDASVFNENNDIAKNLLLVDEDKKYYLISIKGDKRISLKTLSLQLDVKKLSFAKEEDMEELLRVTVGSLTPLALLNDKKHKVKMYIDDKYKKSDIGVHPLVNTCTVWLEGRKLVNLLKENKVEVHYINLEKIL